MKATHSKRTIKKILFSNEVIGIRISLYLMVCKHTRKNNSLYKNKTSFTPHQLWDIDEWGCFIYVHQLNLNVMQYWVCVPTLTVEWFIQRNVECVTLRELSTFSSMTIACIKLKLYILLFNVILYLIFFCYCKLFCLKNQNFRKYFFSLIYFVVVVFSIWWAFIHVNMLMRMV